MNRAIELAKKGGVSAFPNPLVGAVIVHDNKIIGEGFHEKFGEAHAEVNAVNSVNDKTLLAESTIYVTLEPCSHTGKTPPCSDLLIKHRFKRVVIGCLDTFSEVNGKGIEKLQNSGIEVTYPILEKECRELNKRFFTFHEKKRPYFILKWAESNDGFLDKIRTEEKGVNWITGKESKLRVHQLRSEEQAILVGWKTIEIDNPSLTTREVKGKNPLRIVIDPKLQSNPKSTVYTDGFPTIVLNTLKSVQIEATNYIQLPIINIETISQKLHELNILSCIIEGGANTINSFIENNLWDEMYRFVGQIIFQKGISINSISSKPTNISKLGNDTLFHYKK